MGIAANTNIWFHHLIVYTNIVPIAFYGFFDLCSIIEKFRFEKYDKDLLQNKKASIIVNDGDILSDLAHINYVFLDKTGTLTTERVEISKIYVNDKIYEFDGNFMRRNLGNRWSISKKSLTFSEANLKNIEENFLGAQIPSFQNLLPKNKLSQNIINNPEEENLVLTQNDKKNALNPSDIILTQPVIPSKKNLILHSMKEMGENFYKDMDNEDSIQNLMKSFLFCHNARVVYEGMEKNYFQSNRKEEEVLLEFARMHGFSLDQVTKAEMKGEYIVRIQDKKNVHGIIGTNEFSFPRQRFSLLIEEKDDKQISSKLYCKGNLEAMKNQLVLSEEDYEELNQISNYFKEEGVKMMVYAVRNLNETETKEISNKLRNLKFSLMSQEEELEELAVDLEVKLELLGIVGFKEKMRKKVPDMINFFQSIDAGIWVVSGDSYNNVMNCAINGKILKKENEAFRIEDENIQGLAVSIRNILTEIRIILDPFNQLKKNNCKNENFYSAGSIKLTTGITLSKKDAFQNKYVVLNGKSLDLILNNVYLRDHFIFISSLVKVLIGYNLSPQNKESLVKIVRNNFLDCPSVLAIGDGFNDAPMMQSANVGIELMHKNKAHQYEIAINYGDILINNIELVKHLMIFKGIGLYEHFDQLIGLMIYKDVLLGLTLFLYSWLFNFENYQLFESYFVFFLWTYHLFFTNFSFRFF